MNEIVLTEKEIKDKEPNGFVVTSNLKSKEEIKKISEKLGSGLFVLLENENRGSEIKDKEEYENLKS